MSRKRVSLSACLKDAFFNLNLVPLFNLLYGAEVHHIFDAALVLLDRIYKKSTLIYRDPGFITIWDTPGMRRYLNIQRI